MAPRAWSSLSRFLPPFLLSSKAELTQRTRTAHGQSASRRHRRRVRSAHGPCEAAYSFRRRLGTVGSMTDQGKKVLLAAPRGYCAGVDRAVETVEKALEKYGAPVYVRKQIVHNKYVVETLEQRGVTFVDETDEVPEGAHLVFSAHGISPAVRESAANLNLRTLDASCPLVTKVHNEAKRFARDGFHILLVGHEGHELSLIHI